MIVDGQRMREDSPVREGCLGIDFFVDPTEENPRYDYSAQYLWDMVLRTIRHEREWEDVDGHAEYDIEGERYSCIVIADCEF